MKTLLFVLMCLLCSCGDSGDSTNTTTYYCSVYVNDLMPVTEYEKRVEDGEELDAVSTIEVDNEMYINVRVCADDDNDTNTEATTTTLNTGDVDTGLL